ncbi:BTB domain-containing protein [Mycena venus]|uniref:BTB domain-containing protein n=1 Tax=Mycena venus TaxID=2733690 RepID=A0A8H6XBT4_9AGAR|nr:BTB domain-containing protein [Mycena venus]
MIPSSSSSVNGSHAINGSTPQAFPDDAALSSPSASYDDPNHFNGHANGFILDRHNTDIVNHLYHSGFQTGNYADTVLHVHQGHTVTYRLHAIILSRSPFLAHLMSTSPPGNGNVIHLNLERDPEVTHDGFAVALGYLYSSASLALIHEKNCRAVLASAHLLGGMDELCSYSYDACRRSISVDTIGEWLQFIDTIPPPSDGTTTPDLTQTSIFGPYGQRLRDDVFTFLVVTLPQSLDIHPDSSSSKSGGNGRDMLLQIFSRVPFDLFKTAMESPTFEIGSDQTRFKFAKDAIDVRKRGIARGAEETVVLSNFGGSAIHITRKMRKRPLWKTRTSPSFMATFNLFFTGRDDPLSCIIIGEDTVPRFFCFETPERQFHGIRTTVYANNNSRVASLVFGPGKQLGSVTIGGTRAQPEYRTFSMADLVAPGSNHNARSFFSVDGRKYEWRKCANLSGAYDLYALNPPVVRVAAFRRCSEDTPVGRSTGLLQYTFAQEGLLLHTLITLCLNRWVDM